MNLFVLLPAFLGLSVVIQGILNRKIGGAWGLSSAVFLNATIFFMASAGLLLVSKLGSGNLPELFRWQNLDLEKSKWWFLLPGLCGFFLVLGIPWSLEQIGLSKTFIVLIVSQVFFSLLIERFIFQNPVNSLKIIGAFIAIFGAALVVLN